MTVCMYGYKRGISISCIDPNKMYLNFQVFNSSVSFLALVHGSDGNGDDGVDDGVGDGDR